jgi:hypothetical protein
MLLLWQSNCLTYKNLHSKNHATEDIAFLQLITALELLAWVWFAACEILAVSLLHANMS